MLAEFEVLPIGRDGASLSPILADVARLIDGSGLDYRVGSMATVVEGEWDPIMQLAKRCRDAVLKRSDRILMTIRIDERKDKPGMGRIEQKIKSLEAAVGRPLRR